VPKIEVVSKGISVEWNGFFVHQNWHVSSIWKSIGKIFAWFWLDHWM